MTASAEASAAAETRSTLTRPVAVAAAGRCGTRSSGKCTGSEPGSGVRSCGTGASGGAISRVGRPTYRAVAWAGTTALSLPDRVSVGARWSGT